MLVLLHRSRFVCVDDPAEAVVHSAGWGHPFLWLELERRRELFRGEALDVVEVVESGDLATSRPSLSRSVYVRMVQIIF